MEQLAEERRPYAAAAGWLAFLGPFFFVTYGFANAYTATRTDVPALVFDWERHIPFLAWTILPYWTIDVFYAASVFLCRTRAELKTHALRLLSVQILSVACFLLFPLRYTFERPETSGFFGFLFRVLLGFDKPFNQAPSLHISLLLILWVKIGESVRGRVARLVLHVWAVLIGVSVLTTFQHHIIDIPTGLWMGAFCLWLFPDAPLARPRFRAVSADPARRKLALAYGLCALGTGAVFVHLGRAYLHGLWVSFALLIVASAYGFLGADAFQKGADGRMSLAARVLLFPYLAGAFVNSRLWGSTAHDELVPGVLLGRYPTTLDGVGSLVDVSAELPARPGDRPYRVVPVLDLVVPSVDEIAAGVEALASFASCRPTLVACALGYSRSATVAAAWLVEARHASSVDEAISLVGRARPGFALSPAHRERLHAWHLTKT